MHLDDFGDVMKKQFMKCERVLSKKALEYTTTDIDRLEQIKKAAAMQGITVKQALSGMMVKHSTKIYDMISLLEPRSMKDWDEVITDHINYLVLLKAVLVEEDE